MPKIVKEHKMWTKQDFKAIMKLWDTKNTQEIAEELGRTDGSVTAMVQTLRKAGVDLPKKHRNGYISSLVQEFLVDLKKSK